MWDEHTVERRAGDDGPERRSQTALGAEPVYGDAVGDGETLGTEGAVLSGEESASAVQAREGDGGAASGDGTEAPGGDASGADARNADEAEESTGARALSQRDIDIAIGHRLRDAEAKAYARFVEEHAHRLRLGDIAMNILGHNNEAPQQPAQYAYRDATPPPAAQPAPALPQRAMEQAPERGVQGQLPDPDALVRAAQRGIDAIGDPRFTLEEVMSDGRARLMLAQGRDIYEIYGRLCATRQERPARPRVEARANSGMDTVEYDFRSAPREVIDRIDAQLKRGQYVNL